MPDKKSILFLAYYFPPIKSIGIWRNYYLSQEARKYFNQVYIITTNNQKLFEQEELNLEGLDISIVPTFDYRTLKGTKKLSFQEEQKQTYLTSLAIKCLNSFPVSFIIGEGGILYILSGYNKSKTLILKNEITHIYSSYRTIADHVIAYLLKRRFKQIHWTCDFRDLPVDPVYRNYLFKKLQEKVLSKLLSKADLITVFTKGLQAGIQLYANKKVVVLPNGLFTPIDKSINLTNQAYFTIQYTGSLFLNERDPSLLFRAIKELIAEKKIDSKDIIIQYAGKDSSKWNSYIAKHDLECISKNTGEVSTIEARELQTQAHINLLLTSSHQDYQGILTGKFFEYIASKRPVLAMIKGTKDLELEVIFSKYNIGRLFYSNLSELRSLKEYIFDCYEIWKTTGSLNWDTDPEIEQDFSWEKTGKQWLELIS